MAVADRSLAHPGDERLRVAQQQVLQLAAALERPFSTTARLGVVSPPMKSAISAEAPSASTCSSETMLLVGKYT